MCELKTKHFKAVCPYTNSEMEISILCQRIHKTQTLNKHYKKMDFPCPKISEMYLWKKKLSTFPVRLSTIYGTDLFGAFFDVSRFFSI